MSKHKALELADWLDNCEPNFYGESSSRMDDKLASAVSDLTDAARAQHALIVQMREALRQTRASILGWQADEPGPMQRQMGAALLRINDPLAAADQYLGDQV